MNPILARRLRRGRHNAPAIEPVKQMQDVTPLAIQILEAGHIHRQDQCPLFAILPKEIRDLVFEYTLAAYADPDRPYSNNERFARPGAAGHRRVAVELLSTCKAVYLETYLLPITLNPVIAYFDDDSSIPPHARYGLQNLRKLVSWQFAALHTLDMIVQQVRLEGSSLSECATQLQAGPRYDKSRMGATLQSHEDPTDSSSPERLSGLVMPSRDPNIPRVIDKLILRLGRTEWWTWEDPPIFGSSSFGEDDSTPQLAIDPSSGDGWIGRPSSTSRARMLNQASLRRKGEWTGWPNQYCWGAQIAEFKGLKELELVLETFAQKEEQLNVVVECAKTWTFPMDDDFELRWDGLIDKNMWIGVDGYGYEDRNGWLVHHTDLNLPAPHETIEATEEARNRWVESHGLPDHRLFAVSTIRFTRKQREAPL